MAEDIEYSSRIDNKRKLNVPPPPDGIELAKKRAQEIAARLFSVAEAKRIETDVAADDSTNNPFASDQSLKPMGQSIALQFGGTNSTSSSHGFGGSSKKVEIPNGRVGVIIGRSGETIKYLQVQSGARIQITRDVDADPNSLTRSVELFGTSEQISKAEQLIHEVISEADAGGAGIISARKLVAVSVNSEHFSMKVPNNKIGLIIGKGGENIKSMQANCGARIQVIPLHLPLGDPSTERTVHIDGTKEQIELAKQLVNDVISSENRARNPQTGGYRPPMPPTSWVPPAAPQFQQPTYGYMQPGAYPGPGAAPQYSMAQLPYVGYPPPAQQTTQGTGYDYYNQQQQPQQQPPVAVTSVPLDGSNYNYSQLPTAYNGQATYGESYSQPAVGYQQSYGHVGDYNQTGPQAGFAQPISNPQAGYTQQQSFSSAPAYGNAAPSTQEGANPNLGVESSTQQTPSGQQPSAAAQPGYAVTPSQPGYASQPNYSQSAPSVAPPLGQSQQPSQAYGQGQPPASQAGYAQPAQVYGHSGQGYSQIPAAPAGYAQDSQQLASGYVSGAPHAVGYGQPQSYGGASLSQTTSYSQQQTQPHGDTYSGGAYSQPPYSNDGTPASSSDPAAISGAPKASHQS